MLSFKYVTKIGIPSMGHKLFKITFKWACHYDLITGNGVKVHPVTGEPLPPTIRERTVEIFAKNEKLAYQKLMAEFPTTCLEILVNGVWITRGKIVEMF